MTEELLILGSTILFLIFIAVVLIWFICSDIKEEQQDRARKDAVMDQMDGLHLVDTNDH